MPGEPFIHVAFVGIVVQGASALLLALLFLALRRLAADRPYLRDWSVAFAALAIAIAALFVRYLASENYRPGASDFANARAPLTRALYFLYQAGKVAFFAGLLTGAARFAGRRLPLRHAAIAALVVAYAAVSVLANDDLETIVAWQTPAAIATSAAAALLLLRAPLERRSLGTRLTAATCLLLALLWTAYADAFGSSPSSDHVLGRILNAIRSHNSFIDVVLQSVLGLGMVITLFQDLEREADAARAERARLERRLAESHHLESLGVLVSAVAHELNNPLTAILGFSEELAREPERDGESAAAVRVIHEQSLRCRSIVTDLLAFSRPRRRARARIAPGELVERVVRGFVPALRRARVELSVDVERGLPEIDADAIAIEQVLVNLVDNAIDASPQGGVIGVAARRCGEGCELIVEDEGPGVAPAVAERLFEPFFTTKEPGEGTGLGLAVSRRIVTSHGGTIRVEGRRDGRRGARFCVVLPAAVEVRPAPTPGVDRTPTTTTRARAAAPPRILVVDDEAPVRALLRRRLTQQGFGVVEAQDGGDALDQVRRSEVPFDAVITDLKMRGVSGYALVEQLSREAPSLARRTVVITGDLLAPEVARFAAESGCELFEKPLDLERLVGRVALLAGVEISRSVAGPA